MTTTTKGIRSFLCILKYKQGYFKYPDTPLAHEITYMMGRKGQYYNDEQVQWRIKMIYQTSGNHCEVIAIIETTEGTEPRKIL